MRVLAAVLVICFGAPPVNAQWLTRPTPNIPRTPDGKPDLTARAPRTPDGRPDLTGYWYVVGRRGANPEPGAVLPWAQDVARERQERFLKDRPSYRCLPSGPEPVSGSSRILQTSTVIAILNDTLTYRQIFMDGRELERDPEPTWMGYSVGHWDGDTLVVDSVGFNEKTWLNISGLPHTERLRVRERFHRNDFGHLQIEVSFTDPGAYTKPWGGTVDLALAADTEMIEAYCENSSDHWTGTWGDAVRAKVPVAREVLEKYVGVYSGIWAGMPRTVRVALADGELSVTVSGMPIAFPLVAQSDTSFISAQGYVYDFVRTGDGPAAQVVEHHVSGSYTFERQR